MQTDSFFAVGYKPTHITEDDLSKTIHTIDIESTEWKSVENKIVDLITKEEKKNKDQIILPPNRIPFMVVKIASFSTIEKLLDLDEVRYVHSMNSTLFADNIPNNSATERSVVNSLSGCTCEGHPPSLDDAWLISPYVRYPWTFPEHNIDGDTWGISRGQGIGVAVIDSGVSFAQENLDMNGTFISGFSATTRIEERYNFLPELYLNGGPISPIRWRTNGGNANDECGHGTKMAGLIAAPRGEDYNTLGVAYDCNLYNLRAVHSPIIFYMSEQVGVTNALLFAANNDDINIISMSIGMLPGQSSIAISDAIQYAFNLGKMIVCAAGSSPFPAPEPVIFPANLSTTCAITGIREPATYPNELDGSEEACTICHVGDEVDFVVIMQRTGEFNAHRTAPVLACSGDIPMYVAGSSAATAIFSGMAAMVWANMVTQNPAVTNMDVIEKLNNSASNSDNILSNFGYGWVDMDEALQ